MNLIHWLNKPYPLLTRTRDKGWIVLAFGVFTFLFLWLYQPFGTQDVKVYQGLFLLGFGVSVSSSLFITYFVFPWLFQKVFNQDQWKIKKEITFVLVTFLVVAFSNYTYNTLVGAEIGIYRTYIEFLGISLAVGIFPLIVVVFLTELYLNRKNQQAATSLSKQLPLAQVPPSIVQLTITPETTKPEPLMIPLPNFLFATSDNNYSTVFYRVEGTLTRKLLRLSLKNLENQLADVPSIVRCHRSYIVNKDKIKTFKGTARSLTLELEGYDERIPVSRNFPKEKLLAKTDG
ncbi:MAG: LytTR family DNA-binding domain-containing protein [Bacteroidota bacterium]